MDKNKEILELKKVYLVQFEKFETKIFISWMSFVIGLLIAWIYGKVDGGLVISVALFTMFLDWLIEHWRKNSFNKVIKEIKDEDFEEIC